MARVSTGHLKEAIRNAQAQAGVDRPFMPAFRLFEDRVITVHDLEDPENPMAAVIDEATAEALDVALFGADDDQRKIVTSLLNMAVSRQMLRVGLIALAALDLLSLAGAAGIRVTPTEVTLLERLIDFVEWAGRDRTHPSRGTARGKEPLVVQIDWRRVTFIRSYVLEADNMPARNSHSPTSDARIGGALLVPPCRDRASARPSGSSVIARQSAA